MRRNPLIVVSALLVLVTLPAVAQSVEMGGVQNCRLVDLTPTDSFSLGTTSIFQIQAGAVGVEGYFCTVWQEYAPWDNVPHTMAGIGGTLLINQNRSFQIFSEGGPLTGGLFPGQSVVMQYTFPNDPSLLGVQFVVQAYVTNATRTTHNFTSALVGTIR